jgi:hypothetical protein
MPELYASGSQWHLPGARACSCCELHHSSAMYAAVKQDVSQYAPAVKLVRHQAAAWHRAAAWFCAGVKVKRKGGRVLELGAFGPRSWVC